MAPFCLTFMAYRFGGGGVVLSGRGAEVVSPVCPAPLDELLLSGLAAGGAAGSGLTDGEVGVMSGFVLGTVLGFAFGVKSGFVPGVMFGFGAASGAVSGGIVLLGLVTGLLGLVLVLGFVLWGVGFCEPIVPVLGDCPVLLPAAVCASAQQPHSRSMPVTRRILRFMDCHLHMRLKWRSSF